MDRLRSRRFFGLSKATTALALVAGGSPACATTVSGVNVTGHTPRSGVVWSGSVHARVRPWAGDHTKAFLLIGAAQDPLVDPGRRMPVDTWLDTIRGWGYTSVRTNAVTPTIAATLADAGFGIVQDLVLLRRSHDATPAFGIPRDARPRALRRTRDHVADVLDLDGIAFGPEWGLDSAMLTDALAATTVSRIFVARRDDVLQGFVIVGLTGRTGYIQRLAVHPEVRRSGVGARLLARALQWADKRGATHTVVNTETQNAAALALYDKFGFEQLPDRLCVMERAL